MGFLGSCAQLKFLTVTKQMSTQTTVFAIALPGGRKAQGSHEQNTPACRQTGGGHRGQAGAGRRRRRHCRLPRGGRIAAAEEAHVAAQGRQDSEGVHRAEEAEGREGMALDDDNGFKILQGLGATEKASNINRVTMLVCNKLLILLTLN